MVNNGQNLVTVVFEWPQSALHQSILPRTLHSLVSSSLSICHWLTLLPVWSAQLGQIVFEVVCDFLFLFHIPTLSRDLYCFNRKKIITCTCYLEWIVGYIVIWILVVLHNFGSRHVCTSPITRYDLLPWFTVVKGQYNHLYTMFFF